MLLAGRLLLLTAFTGSAFAQDKPDFTADTKEVTLYVSVTDKDGKIIPNIPKTSFRVTENGIEQTLKVFRRDDVPVSMCVVIDSSGSMKDKYARVRAAAVALIKASNRDDEICIVNFNDRSIKDQSFTNDMAKLEEALERIETMGGTAMRDALSATVDYMKSEGKRDKKVIVLVSDGNDNSSSRTTIEDLLRLVRESEVLVYSIGLLDEEDKGEAKKAKRVLDQLAEDSGGFTYYPKTLSDVEEITPQIAHEIRNQYIMAYEPLGELDGSYRRLKVEVRGVRGSTVRHRSGYYAGLNPTNRPGAAPAKTGRPNE
jgi:VWFA-related protein